MPLTYERAFGGTHVTPSGKSLSVARDPVGRGFRGQRGMSELVGLPLPNLEDPRRPVAEAGDRAEPACFAPIAPSWSPRKEYVGTYDETWRKRRAPFLPADFDERFFQVASSDLIAPTFLKGGEIVSILHALKEGVCQFTLPLCEPAIRVDVAGKQETPRASLETVLIEPDEHRVCMLWRASVLCDKKVLQVRHVVAHLNKLQLEP